MSENTFNRQHDTDEVYHYRPVSTLQIPEDATPIEGQTKIPYLFLIKTSARFVAT
jgi:hypothetical protein